MREINKLRMLALMLVATFLLFAAQLGWCSSNFTFPSNSTLRGCDVAQFPNNSSPEGMVIRPDGTVLVAVYLDGLYTFAMPTSLLRNCPSSPPLATKLSSVHVRGMAMTLDGRVYANDNSGNIVEINPTFGTIVRTVLTGVDGLGMALDPYTGDIFVTDNSTVQVFEISGLPGTPQNPPTKSTFITLTGATNADGLAWSCDGKYLLVADYGGDKVWRVDRSKNVSSLSFPPGTGPDGVAFGAPGTPLANYAYANTNGNNACTIPGQIYQFQFEPTLLISNPVATNGEDGDFVTVDGSGNLLATQAPSGFCGSGPSLITAVFWTQGNGSGGFVLPGGALCQSLHCATSAGVTKPACINGTNADTANALADAACSASSCGGCATVNLELTTLITLLKDFNDDGCLSAAISGAETLYNRCPCNPDPNVCPQLCDPTTGCGGNIQTRLKDPDFDFYDPAVRRVMALWRMP